MHFSQEEVSQFDHQYRSKYHIIYFIFNETLTLCISIKTKTQNTSNKIFFKLLTADVFLVAVSLKYYLHQTIINFF